MYIPHQIVAIKFHFGKQGQLSPPVELLEQEEIGTRGWEKWLVLDQSGKKEIRWITPGSQIIDVAEPPKPTAIAAAHHEQVGPLFSKNGLKQATKTMKRQSPAAPPSAEDQGEFALSDIYIRVRGIEDTQSKILAALTTIQEMACPPY